MSRFEQGKWNSLIFILSLTYLSDTEVDMSDRYLDQRVVGGFINLVII